jgi:hypothetical protein
MLKRLILITILFHFHNFANGATVQERKGLFVKERFSSNLYIIKDAPLLLSYLMEVVVCGNILTCGRID